MASRLVPLLVAVAIAAPGCGGSPTASAGGSSPTIANGAALLWAVGDSAGGAYAPAVVRLIRAGDPDRVLYLGDIYNGDAGFRAFSRLYGPLPVARTPGNHDWPHHWHGSEWYSFTIAGWRIIELNSETGKPAQQLKWLRGQLRARGTCRIAFWHKPRFSAGPHGDATYMDPYWRMLEGHATLVLSGHDHDMERFGPRNGLVQIVAGAGGESHYPIIDPHHPGLLFADSTHWGALRLALRRGSASVAFVATNGRTLDSQTYKCS